MGALLEIVREVAVAMAHMQKRPMEETPPSTSNEDRVPHLPPPQFEVQLVTQFEILEEQRAEQFLVL